MLVQANKTGTSNNTTNEKEKKTNNDRSTLHINYVALNPQYALQILNHLAQHVCMIFS